MMPSKAREAKRLKRTTLWHRYCAVSLVINQKTGCIRRIKNSLPKKDKPGGEEMEGLFILLLYLTPICFILALLGYIADKIPNKAYRKIERKWASK